MELGGSESSGATRVRDTSVSEVLHYHNFFYYLYCIHKSFQIDVHSQVHGTSPLGSLVVWRRIEELGSFFLAYIGRLRHQKAPVLPVKSKDCDQED